jgi:PAS domain S-box-containing protein
MRDDFRAHLAAIVESSDDAIVSETLDGLVTSWNAAAVRLFGYQPDEVIGKPITVIIPPELNPEREEPALLEQVRRGQGVEHYETVRLTKSGVRLPVSLSISPVRDESGQIVAAAKILRDITAQKRTEQALYDEARALETLNRVNQTIAAELDLERLVQAVTDAATELTGAAFGAFFYNLEDEKGESYTLYSLSGVAREAFASFPLPRNTALFGPTFRGEGVVRIDDVRKDPRHGKNEPYHGMPPGHLPVVSYLAVPVVSRAGGVIGGLFFGHPEPARFNERAERLVVGIATQAAIGIDNARLYQAAQREINERKRVEAELRRSEQLYRAIGESMDYGIWVCDADGRNVYASESFLRLVGLTQEECSNFGWGSVLHPDDVEPTIAAWQRCVQTGGFWDTEHRYRGVDGAYHPVLARGVAVRDEHGKVLCWAGINLDVQRLKHAEEALREADRRKDEFLAILAHELRNPLAPIRYALAIAKQPGRSAEQQRQAEDVVERQVEHMSRLLEDLLDVSRITHGTLELRKVRIDLGAIVTSAIEAARPLLDAKQHTLSVELPEEVIELEADPVRMAQVFANLLINSAKYTDPGGQIVLRARRSGGEAVVSVRDNGIGITPEMMPRLFTLFSQAGTALERSEGGLGIGLALAQGLLQLHGGCIEARSDGRHQGSEFIVRLPLSPTVGVAPGPAVHEPAAISSNRLRVLVADDNRDSAELSAALLELWGHEAYTGHTGREALDLATQHRPHVSLLDIGMPDLNGYEVAAELRKKTWGQSMLLIAVTGWGREEDKKRALSAGFDHHLTKPIDPQKLRSLLSGLEPRASEER